MPCASEPISTLAVCRLAGRMGSTTWATWWHIWRGPGAMPPAARSMTCWRLGSGPLEVSARLHPMAIPFTDYEPRISRRAGPERVRDREIARIAYRPDQPCRSGGDDGPVLRCHRSLASAMATTITFGSRASSRACGCWSATTRPMAFRRQILDRVEATRVPIGSTTREFLNAA